MTVRVDPSYAPWKALNLNESHTSGHAVVSDVADIAEELLRTATQNGRSPVRVEVRVWVKPE